MQLFFVVYITSLLSRGHFDVILLCSIQWNHVLFFNQQWHIDREVKPFHMSFLFFLFSFLSLFLNCDHFNCFAFVIFNKTHILYYWVVQVQNYFRIQCHLKISSVEDIKSLVFYLLWKFYQKVNILFNSCYP